MIRVMICDDQDMIRIGLTAVLDSFPDIEVVGAAPDGFSALRELDALDPDVILMDIRMPGIDGVETTRRIKEQRSDGRPYVVVLTTFDDDQNIFAALRAGASGFLNKASGPEELAQAVRSVVAGGGALSASVAASLIDHVATTKPASADAEMLARFQALTVREHEIVRSVVSGDSNEEIAGQLFLSPYTVKTHVNRAMAKVGARDRAQLIAFAHRAGLA